MAMEGGRGRCRIRWVRVELPESSRKPEGWELFASLSCSSERRASFTAEERNEPHHLGRDPQKCSDGSIAASQHEVSILDKVGISALAGGIAGGFANATLHPIDTVKTKLQTRGSASIYSGPFDVISKVFANQGIWGFYSGVHAAFVGSVVSSAAYFGTYELAKCLFSSIATFPKAVTPPLAAALGNVVSSAILVPKEVVKQRMQAGAVGSARDVILHTIKSEGFAGLYSGYSAALLRNIPSNMMTFSTFEYLKVAWLSMSNASILTPWQSVLSGALAGALSAAVTTPLDVVKTRLMTQARSVVKSSGVTGVRAEALARGQAIAAYTYTGVLSTMQQICREEGFGALLKGMTPRLLYSACFSALGFCAFESMRTFFLLRHVEQKKKMLQQ